MKVALINGSPRKGNTYKVTQIFMDELAMHGEIDLTEFFPLLARISFFYK